MRNFMDFKTFSSLDEGRYSDDYYDSLDFGLAKKRKTAISKRLEKVRSRVRNKFDINFRNKAEYDYYDAFSFVTSKLSSGILGVAAGLTDFLFGKPSKEDEKGDKTKDADSGFESWKNNLSPSTTLEDLDKYAEETQNLGMKKFGKDFDPSNPKTPEEKMFVARMKRGESEILNRMKF